MEKQNPINAVKKLTNSLYKDLYMELSIFENVKAFGGVYQIYPELEEKGKKSTENFIFLGVFWLKVVSAYPVLNGDEFGIVFEFEFKGQSLKLYTYQEDGEIFNLSKTDKNEHI